MRDISFDAALGSKWRSPGSGESSAYGEEYPTEDLVRGDMAEFFRGCAEGVVTSQPVAMGVFLGHPLDDDPVAGVIHHGEAVYTRLWPPSGGHNVISIAERRLHAVPMDAEDSHHGRQS